MFNPWFLLAVVLALVGAGVGGYHMGYDAAEGEHALQRQRDIAAAWNAGRAEIELESERARQAVLAIDFLSTRLRQIDRANPVPARPDCRWTDAERGLLEHRRAAYLAADHPAPPGPLHGTVPDDARDRPRPAADRQGLAGLGLRLPGEAAGVPRLGGVPD